MPYQKKPTIAKIDAKLVRSLLAPNPLALWYMEDIKQTEDPLQRKEKNSIYVTFDIGSLDTPEMKRMFLDHECPIISLPKKHRKTIQKYLREFSTGLKQWLNVTLKDLPKFNPMESDFLDKNILVIRGCNQPNMQTFASAGSVMNFNSNGYPGTLMKTLILNIRLIPNKLLKSGFGKITTNHELGHIFNLDHPYYATEPPKIKKIGFVYPQPDENFYRSTRMHALPEGFLNCYKHLNLNYIDKQYPDLYLPKSSYENLPLCKWQYKMKELSITDIFSKEDWIAMSEQWKLTHNRSYVSPYKNPNYVPPYENPDVKSILTYHYLIPAIISFAAILFQIAFRNRR
ncbi:MAG: hypothetical protein AAGA27_02590 [Pseudomonadota bacterium]